MILINSWCIEELQLDLQSHRVFVDKACGEAILRGANVFAPGILSMPSGYFFIFHLYYIICREYNIERINQRICLSFNDTLLTLFIPHEDDSYS